MSQDELKQLWEKFGDIPVDKDDNLDLDFVCGDIIWTRGTDKFEVWHWFDEEFKNGLYQEMFSKL